MHLDYGKVFNCGKICKKNAKIGPKPANSKNAHFFSSRTVALRIRRNSVYVASSCELILHNTLSQTVRSTEDPVTIVTLLVNVWTCAVANPGFFIRGGGWGMLVRALGGHRTPLHCCVFVNTVITMHLNIVYNLVQMNLKQKQKSFCLFQATEALEINLVKATGVRSHPPSPHPPWIRHWTPGRLL